MDDESTCADYLAALAADRDLVVARLAEEMAAEAAGTPAGRANLVYLCTQSGTTSLRSAVSQTGARAGQLDGRHFEDLPARDLSAGERSALLAAATDGVVRVFGYDYRRVSTDLRRVADVLTPYLRDRLIPQLERRAAEDEGVRNVVTPTVLSAGLAGLNSDYALVLVLVEQKFEEPGSDVTEPPFLSFVTVQKSGSRWLVDKFGEEVPEEFIPREPDARRVAVMRAAEEFYDGSGDGKGGARVNRTQAMGVEKLDGRRATVLLVGQFLAGADADPRREAITVELRLKGEDWIVEGSRRTTLDDR